jgi:hypothetical protein
MERIFDFLTQADPIPAACVNLTFTDFLEGAKNEIR